MSCQFIKGENVMSKEQISKVYVERVDGVAEAISSYVKYRDTISLENEARKFSSREIAHEKGLSYSPMNGEQPIFALLSYSDINSLYGRLLTIVDASFTDREQRKAVKDLVRNALWFDWVPNLDTDDPSHGAPVWNQKA